MIERTENIQCQKKKLSARYVKNVKNDNTK